MEPGLVCLGIDPDPGNTELAKEKRNIFEAPGVHTSSIKGYIYIFFNENRLQRSLRRDGFMPQAFSEARGLKFRRYFVALCFTPSTALYVFVLYNVL